MNRKKHSHFFLKYIFLAITGIFLLQHGNGLSAFDSTIHQAVSIYNELVVLPPDTVLLNLADVVSFSDQQKGPIPHGSGSTGLRSRIPPFTDLYLVNPISEIRQVVTNHPAVRIIHKKHIWHQSSDDETPPHPSPFIV